MKAVGVIVVTVVVLFLLMGGLFVLCVLPQADEKPKVRT